MPAPDLETIFDVENAIETACKTVIQSLGARAFTQRECEDLPQERVDIQLQLGAPTGHRGNMMPGQSPGQHVRDAWNGLLTFNLFTPRTESNGNGNSEPVDKARHGRLRAKVRIATEYFSDRFTEELLPYHVLVSIAQAGTDPQVNVDDDLDVSALQFNVVIAVRPGAWPVG